MLLILIGCLCLFRVQALTYSYSDTSNWPSGCSANELQSPINIADADYEKVNELTDSWPSSGATATAANADQTIVITMDDPTKSSIRSIPTYEEQTFFYLQQIAFHFGTNNTSGSAHSIYGVFYPLEVHFTFYNSEFNTYATASNTPQGLVEYSVLFNVSETASTPLASVLSSLNSSSFYDGTSSVALGAINYTALLPDSFRYKFFYYSGSKDYPDCTDNVLWLIANETMDVSAEQLLTLRSFNVTSSGPSLAPNYRSTQQLNDRKVYRTFKDEEGEAGPTGKSYILALFFIFASLICVAIAVTSAVLKNRQYHVIEDVPQ